MPSPDPRPIDDVLDQVVRDGAKRMARRQRRRRGAALGVVAVVVFVGGLVVAQGGTRSSGPASIGTTTTIDRAPLEEPEGWAPMAEAPISPRSSSATAWTGTELLVWRGQGAFSDGGGGEPGRTDGAAYDPAADRWRPMADDPLPDSPNVIGAYQYASAWTGRELIVWGGPGPEAAAYDPATDTWRRIDPGPLEERTQFASVWTGTELVVVGGGRPLFDVEDDEVRLTGATYDPTTDRWRDVPAMPRELVGLQGVWDGTEVLVVGEEVAGDETSRRTLAFGLDVETMRWTERAAPPMDRVMAPPVWTGDEVVAVGAGPRPETDEPDGRPAAPSSRAAAYDPSTGTWREVPVPEGFDTSTLAEPIAVWSGREVLLLGSSLPWFTSADEPPAALQGVAFDPASGTWRALPDAPLTPRNGAVREWTGTELLVWGGEASNGYTSDPFGDGARYRPGPGR